MDKHTIFVVTLKGEGELKNHTRHLPEEVKRALLLVDDEATVEVLTRRASPSLRASLAGILQQLVVGGFIQDKARMGNVPRMAVPKMVVPAKKTEEEDTLDFTTSGAVSDAGTETRKLAEAKEKQEAVHHEVEKERAKAEQQAVAIQAQLKAAQAKAEVETKARAEAEARVKHEMEASRLRAEQEAVRVRAEAEAVRTKAELDAAKAKAELV